MLSQQETLKYMKSQVYFFVDDQKGLFKGANNPQNIWIRSFDEIEGIEFQGLVHSLMKKEAWKWHATEKNGFPQSADFLKILRKINRCNSKLYQFTRTEQQVDSPEFIKDLAEFKEVCRNESWIKHWDFEKRQPKLLLWSIISTLFSHWRGHKQRWDAPPAMLTFITDRMDFYDEKVINKELKQKSIFPDGCVKILEFETRIGIGVRIFGIKSKKDKNIDKKILSLLSIPDGEIWLWNRLISFESEEGKSIAKAGIEYAGLDQASCNDYNFPLSDVLYSLQNMTFTKASFKKLNRKILTYRQFLSMWLQRR
jgi:hypothetical protein